MSFITSRPVPEFPQRKRYSLVTVRADGSKFSVPPPFTVTMPPPVMSMFVLQLSVPLTTSCPVPLMSTS